MSICCYTSEKLKIHINNTEAIDSVKNYKTLTSSALSILATCSSSQSWMTVLLKGNGGSNLNNYEILQSYPTGWISAEVININFCGSF
jgi:hypothetical protein